MAESQPIRQENHSGNYPTHPADMSCLDPLLTSKSLEPNIPNGVVRLVADNNGLINHGMDVTKTKPLEKDDVNLLSKKTDGHDRNKLSEVATKTDGDNPETDSCEHDLCTCDDPKIQTNHLEEECSCDSSKSSNQNIQELKSEFDSLNIDKSLPGDEKDSLLGIEYVVYKSEVQMPDIMRLITKDLSEPYSIYTYRYFIHNWPKLCFLAMDTDKCVGAIVCKLDMHKKMVRRGYIAMLAVDSEYRRKKIGSHLVLKAIKAMIADDCDEVVLETEITNQSALRLYENLGFVRDKRLFRYYLNGVDALRLKLWLR